ncbi:hypothetical protein [Paraburkholderia sp. JPY419]|uniref:hypothetical protein n=1 Tax=Paraburkholderia sp. JPY419 TaxID=667660 RepID=UPI003D19FF1C
MNGSGEQDGDIGKRSIARPTLTDERNHPNHWYNRGADLHASAGALWYAMKYDAEQDIAENLGFRGGFRMDVACYPVYHMLCGLALEVIMKAVLIQRGHAIPKTHRLTRLSDLLGLTGSDEEHALLRFYEQAISWAGRYPVPLNCSDDLLRGYSSLVRDALTMPVRAIGASGPEIRRGNGATRWERFSPMWHEIAALFKHA